jgi:hypothetical protein
MIELRDDHLVFSFPEIHEQAKLSAQFQRTLRIPDDDRSYPLPPGLGPFPLRHVDDFATRVPSLWVEHGGVMLPMYQSEALWLHFMPGSFKYQPYPFAIKVAAGKINAVTGESWEDGMNRDPQDYMVTPGQPWLDGFCVEKGVIRQFVAMPLGTGYSAEEQITGKAEHGGLQITVYPMKREVYERRFPKRERRVMGAAVLGDARLASIDPESLCSMDMGLSPGGRMRQEIFDDPFDFEDWDLRHASRCFVHIANSETWQEITGHYPPTKPPTAKQYSMAGLPWFEYYDTELKALPGSSTLEKLKSVAGLKKEKREDPLPDNEPVIPEQVVTLRRGLAEDQVREGKF